MKEIPLFLLLATLSFVCVDGQVQRKRVNESKKLTYIFLAAFIAVIFFCLLYCIKKICPRVDMYSPLELDEIRLERAQDREGKLAMKIDKMKSKLANLRKTRTEVQTRKDIAANIEDRVDKFNAKGRAVYGDAWEGKNGAVPIRELVKIPESDVRAMQMEAQAIVTARKEEEKQDLWDLWHKDDVELGNRSGANDVIAGAGKREKETSSPKPSERLIKSSKTSQPRREGNMPSASRSPLSPPPAGIKPPTKRPPPPASKARDTSTIHLPSNSSSAGVIKRFGSKKFIGPPSDDDSGTDQPVLKVPSRSAPSGAITKNTETVGGDGGAPMVIDRSKMTVKVPAHLMKKYPPVNSSNVRNENQQHQRTSVNQRKPRPPIAPPPGPPPSHAFTSSTRQASDRKLK